jgi:hypothetical protein
MPPALAAGFTQAEMAAFRIVSDEVRHHGVCALHIDAIAARAGICRTTVKNALREARRLNLVTVQERRRAGQRSLPNIIHIISREWRDWLAKGVGSENRPPRTSVQNRRRKTEALAVAGNGITDTTTTKERDTDAPKGATPFEGR